jgi:uncharacterized surface protein with fasciclin (FAS1) repeats
LTLTLGQREAKTQFWTSNISDALAKRTEFKTLVQALDKAGLKDTLKSNGPFTLFAPTDDAFANLSSGTLERWTKDVPKLINILNFHIVDHEITSKEIYEMTRDGRSPRITTLQGSPVTLKTVLTPRSVLDSKVTAFADDAKIVKGEIEVANGIIHSIDRVLLPFSFLTA